MLMPPLMLGLNFHIQRKDWYGTFSYVRKVFPQGWGYNLIVEDLFNL